MNNSFDIIEHIRQLDPKSDVLITSYKFNSDFFEKYVFSHFRPPSYPLILIDSNEYQENEDSFQNSKNAGRRYFVEKIACSNIFHPKLFLSISQDKFEFYIGSNNLTWDGYTGNAEIITPILIDKNNSEYSYLLNDLKDFLQELMQLTKSDQIKQQINKITDAIPNEEFPWNREAWLLHNIGKKSLLLQIEEIIGGPIQKIHILCPYFSQNKAIYEKIAEICDEISFYIQQRTTNLPTKLLEDFQNFKYFNVEIENNRFLHAKIFFLETSSQNYCFSGSPNFTDSALLTNNNAELGVLIKTKFSFNGIVKQIGKIKKITLDEIESQEENIFEFKEKSQGPSIIEATVKEGKILVTLDDIQDISQFELQINGVTYPLPYTVEGNLVIFSPDENIFSILKRSAVIKLSCKKEKEEIITEFRLLFNKVIFPDELGVLNYADVDDINWFFKILNKLIQLPNLSEYFRVLNEMDEKGILESDQKKEKIAEAHFERGHYNPNEKINDLVSKFIERHNYRIKNVLKQFDRNDLGTIIFSFILTNKLIFWSIVRDIKPINELYFISNNLKSLFIEKTNFIDKLNAEDIEKCLNDYQLKCHVVVTVYLIDYLQSNSPEYADYPNLGYNPVKQKFEQNIVRALEKVIAVSNPLINQNEFRDVLHQYSEIIPQLESDSLKSIEIKLNELIKNVAVREGNKKFLEIKLTN